MARTVFEVTISLLDVPKSGQSKMLIRLKGTDKAVVDDAANRIGMKQSDFIRTAVVNAAQEVLNEIATQDGKPVVRREVPGIKVGEDVEVSFDQAPSPDQVEDEVEEAPAENAFDPSRPPGVKSDE